jgi:hypothetical protein
MKNLIKEPEPADLQSWIKFWIRYGLIFGAILGVAIYFLDLIDVVIRQIAEPAMRWMFGLSDLKSEPHVLIILLGLLAAVVLFLLCLVSLRSVRRRSFLMLGFLRVLYLYWVLAFSDFIAGALENVFDYERYTEVFFSGEFFLTLSLWGMLSGWIFLYVRHHVKKYARAALEKA